MIYLYVKIHNITGMKYFGKTEKDNYHSYSGSGKEWLKHLKMYGKNYKTELIFSSESKEEIKQMGKYYSELWNIVESAEWANLRPETGDGVPLGTKLTEEHRRKLSFSGKGRKILNTETTKNQNLKNINKK